MTKVDVVQDHGYVRITISGHTGYGRALGLGEGCDIVCSAVSILGQTAAQSVMDMESMGLIDSMEIRMEPGDIDISAGLKPAAEERMRIMLETIKTGFELIAATYPDHVRIGWASGENFCDTLEVENEKDTRERPC